MENQFFTFIRPFLAYIDNGHFYRKPFSWLYALMAVLNLIAPFYVLYTAIDNDVFRGGAKIIFLFFLIWIMVAFVGWISFQLWWDRKDRVLYTTSDNDEFVATPVFSHLIQTTGEWLGIWIAVLGAWAALLITLFLGDEGGYLARQIGLDFIDAGFMAIIIMPIYGFMTIVFTRFLAELFRALASIANNTRRI